MNWVQNTHGTRFELLRHFLSTMFDSDMFTSRGQWQKVAISAFALALPAGMLLLDPEYTAKYSRLSTLATANSFRSALVADELALLTLALSIAGLVALLQWQALFPSRRDYLALASLPVTSGQIFSARCTSVLVFFCLLILALVTLPSLMAPLQFQSSWQSIPYAKNVAAQFLSAAMGCLFIVFSIILLQGLLLNVLPGKFFTRASAFAVSLAVSVFGLAGLSSAFLARLDGDDLEFVTRYASWAPPVWFACLYEWQIGIRSSFINQMAMRACLAFIASLLLCAVTYVVSYRHYRVLLLENPVQNSALRSERWSVLRLLNARPRQEAIIQFIGKTLARSRVHRTVLLCYVGGAVAVVVHSSLITAAAHHWNVTWRQTMGFASLFWPLATSAIMLAGLRHTFRLPLDLPANWVFQLNETEGRAEWMSALSRFSSFAVILPIHLLYLPIAIFALGGSLAARMTLLQILVSLSAFEFLFQNWQQLPFTCSYIPGKRSLMTVISSWLAVLGFVVPVLSIFIATVCQLKELFWIGFVVLAGTWMWARKYRSDGWGDNKVFFEEQPDGPVDLKLNEIRGAIPDPASVALALSSAPPASSPPTFNSPRFWSILDRSRMELDLEDEIAFHLAMKAERLQADGHSALASQAAANRQFGNRTAVKEACRDLLLLGWFESLIQDLRYGARNLKRSPGYAIAAALTLALGIGATTAVFSMCNALLWRPVALPDVQRLVCILQAFPENPHFWSPAAPADIADLTHQMKSVSGLASWQDGLTNLVIPGREPVRVERVRATVNFFDILGVRPALGRAFHADESEPGRDDRVILSNECWHLRFDGDPSVLGKSIRLDGRPFTVIGVMPASFSFPRPSRELWIPLALSFEERGSRTMPMFDSIARMQPGATLPQVSAELQVHGRTLEKEHPLTNRNRAFVAWPVQRYLIGDYAPRFGAILFAAAFFVLLLACANTANLQLARSLGRSREIAVRTALGAGRLRLLRQFLTENLLLACGGAAIGFLAASWALQLLKAGIPAEMRHYMVGWREIGIDGQALMFTCVVALLSGIIAGFAPALHLTRTDVAGAMKSGAAGGLQSSGSSRLRGVLVAVQIALATVLLIGTSIMVGTFQASFNAGASLNPKTMVTFRLTLPENRYRDKHQIANLYREVLARCAALPGVSSAFLITGLPYTRHSASAGVFAEGSQQEPGKRPVAQIQTVSSDSIRTLNVALRSGRALSDTDTATAAPVAVVSEQFARKWWPADHDPIGRRIKVQGREDEWITVVGVVGNMEQSILSRDTVPTLYLPYTQSSQREMDFGIRASISPTALFRPVTDAIRSIDREQPISNLTTLKELIEQESFGFAYIALLIGTFGIIALALSSIGVYGVMSHWIAGRTQELGIRAALGATKGAVLSMVFRQGAKYVLAGLCFGLIPAYALGRILKSVVWGAASNGPANFLLIIFVLGVSAGFAILIPAFRATTVDPVTALRNE